MYPGLEFRWIVILRDLLLSGTGTVRLDDHARRVPELLHAFDTAYDHLVRWETPQQAIEKIRAYSQHVDLHPAPMEHESKARLNRSLAGLSEAQLTLRNQICVVLALGRIADASRAQLIDAATDPERFRSWFPELRQAGAQIIQPEVLHLAIHVLGAIIQAGTYAENWEALLDSGEIRYYARRDWVPREWLLVTRPSLRWDNAPRKGPRLADVWLAPDAKSKPLAPAGTQLRADCTYGGFLGQLTSAVVRLLLARDDDAVHTECVGAIRACLLAGHLLASRLSESANFYKALFRFSTARGPARSEARARAGQEWENRCDELELALVAFEERQLSRAELKEAFEEIAGVLLAIVKRANSKAKNDPRPSTNLPAMRELLDWAFEPAADAEVASRVADLISAFQPGDVDDAGNVARELTWRALRAQVAAVYEPAEIPPDWPEHATSLAAMLQALERRPVGVAKLASDQASAWAGWQ